MRDFEGGLSSLVPFPAVPQMSFSEDTAHARSGVVLAKSPDAGI